VYLNFLEAVILILKHATFLRLSNVSSESALTRADLEYREANIDLKIKQQIMASSQENSMMLFAGFIMATDIGLSILASIKSISHQVCTESMQQDVLVPSQSSVKTDVHRKKDHWFKQVFSRQSGLPKLKNNK